MEFDLGTLWRQIETLSKHPQDEWQATLSPKVTSDLRKKLNRLSVALEEPGDIVDRIVYSPIDLITIRLAVDLGIFRILTDSQTPKSIKQLSEETEADPILLGRVLRCLSSVDAVAEAGPENYMATKISRAFTTAKGVSGANFFVDCLLRSWASLPTLLAESQYQNPTDNLHTGLQLGLRTESHAFEWFSKHPRVFNHFNNFMTAQREGRAYWLDFYPFEQKLTAEAGNNAKDVIFVDVGGALGSEIKELRKRYPTLKGKMILQDRQQTVDLVSADPGMVAMVHDFFTPQPVIGARSYYLRNILHDWPDPLARLILQQIRDAMKAGISRLLINELIVPLEGGGLFLTHSDLNMMSICAGMERTETQWKQLLASAGLQIEKIWTGPGETESIIEAVVAVVSNTETLVTY